MLIIKDTLFYYSITGYGCIITNLDTVILITLDIVILTNLDIVILTNLDIVFN